MYFIKILFFKGPFMKNARRLLAALVNLLSHKSVLAVISFALIIGDVIPPGC